ncbi:MAG: alpha/beta hydrolase [Oscillospiraceae bacterium]|nr:alpha/beta hydrolase [Oscillospiraceae bacterium]
MIDILEVTLPELTGDVTRRAYIYIPEAARCSDQHFPVLYMFDGHNVFFDEHATYGKSWGMGKYLDENQIPMMVAAVECNSAPDYSRLSEYSPYDFSSQQFGNIKGRGRLTMDWIINSFKPDVDRYYPSLPGREDTFIAGSSMGGLMSLYAVCCFNSVFSRAAALSPSLGFGANMLEELILKADIAPDTVIYMDMGETEMNWPGVADNFRRFCGLLQDRNILLTSRTVPGGMHCEASWERQIPFFVPTLLYRPEDRYGNTL